MADTTQGDTDGQYLALQVPALIALIAGLLIQSFIIGVNVTDWWKGRSVTPVDLIVTSLGISRMGTQCAVTLYVFVDTFFLINLHTYITLGVIGAVYTFFTCANIWLTSLLSIVLFLKISNLHTRLFLYLRGMIIHRTGYLIVALIFISSKNSLMHLLMMTTTVTEGGRYNTTKICTYTNFVYIYTIEPFFPLLFYCISSVLLFTSMYHHITKMKMSSNLSISLETYYSVMKLVSVTIIYNALYLIGQIIGVFYYYCYCVFVDWLYIVLDFLPGLHSSYLIYRTSKLRSQMSKVLQNVIDFLSQRKDPETIEKIKVVAK